MKDDKLTKAVRAYRAALHAVRDTQGSHDAAARRAEDAYEGTDAGEAHVTANLAEAAWYRAQVARTALSKCHIALIAAALEAVPE